jgi:exosortase
MATALGLRAVIEGTTIHVPGYTFSVVAACSGLKSVIAMTALAALYAYLVDASWWKRLVIFAGAIPVALVANGVRVMVALVLGQALGPGAAEGYTHSFSGTLVFILAFLGLAALGGILRCNRLRPDW